MDIKNLFVTVNQELTSLVKQITPEQLDMTMPEYASFNEGQKLRTSLNILAYENHCVPRVLSGATDLVANPDFKEDLLRNDYAGNYETLANMANEAVRNHTDMNKEVHISYGDFSVTNYLTDICIQRCTSLYDISALTGIPANLPDNVVSQLHDIATSYASFLREYGIFPPEIKVRQQASPEDKLLAMMGRQPKDPAAMVPAAA